MTDRVVASVTSWTHPEADLERLLWRSGCVAPANCLPVISLQSMPASLTTMMSQGFQRSQQDFTFGPWRVTAVKNHIMKSKDIER